MASDRDGIKAGGMRVQLHDDLFEDDTIGLGISVSGDGMIAPLSMEAARELLHELAVRLAARGIGELSADRETWLGAGRARRRTIYAGPWLEVPDGQ